MGPRRGGEAATAFITEDHVRESFGCGPDIERHLEVAQGIVDAGFDQLTLVNAGPDPEGFFEFLAAASAARRESRGPGPQQRSRPP